MDWGQEGGAGHHVVGKDIPLLVTGLYHPNK